MNNGLSKTLGRVLLVAVVFAATGCTPVESPSSTGVPHETSPSPASDSASPDSGSPGPSAAAPSAESSAAAPSAESSAAAPSAGAAGTAAVTGAPQVEAPHAAPEPTFAPPEKQYLASRVPAGTDPNAILQMGQERCTQLETVKAADEKAVISQLIEKTDADMVAAITGLCPDLQPELDAAARGFTDGDFTIGAAAPKEGSGSISAGRYEAWGPSPTCLLLAYDAAGTTIAESKGTSAVTIPASAARVVSDGCSTWLSS